VAAPLIYVLSAPFYLGGALLIAAIPLMLAAAITKRFRLMRLGLRAWVGGVGLELLSAGLVGVFASTLFLWQLAADSSWVALVLVPIFWLIGGAFAMGGVKTLQWAIRRDRDPLRQWGVVDSFPDGWR
jgi:hypothetical protein